MIVVCDTSPLINLAIVGHLELIPRLFGTVVLPKAVFDEIVVAGSGMPGSVEIRQADWLEVHTCTNHLFAQTLMDELDEGEAEAIVLALELGAELVLLDEDLGRRIALKYDLCPLGVLGILLRAKQAGMVPLVKPIMDDLIAQARFFIHRRLYDDVLKLAGE